MKLHQSRVFNDLTHLYEKFRVPFKNIVFEGNLYVCEKVLKKSDVEIAFYWSEEDRHELIIYSQNQKVFYTENQYIIRSSNLTSPEAVAN